MKDETGYIMTKQDMKTQYIILRELTDINLSGKMPDDVTMAYVLLQRLLKRHIDKIDE